MSAASHVAKGAAYASKGIQTAHAVAGLPTPPAWAGYWTFVTASIILAFILYTAKHGTLNTWVGFFSWTNPAPIGSAGAPTSASSSNPSGAFGGSTGNSGVAGQILNPSTDPVAGPVSGVIGTVGKLLTNPGSFFGLGN